MNYPIKPFQLCNFLILFGFFSCFAQESFKHSFDMYSVIVYENGFETKKTLLGTDCYLHYISDKGIYFVKCDTLEAIPIFQIINGHENDTNEILVKMVGDDSPKKMNFVVKDSIESRQKLEFVGTSLIGDDNNIGITWQLHNNAL